MNSFEVKLLKAVKEELIATYGHKGIYIFNELSQRLQSRGYVE